MNRKLHVSNELALPRDTVTSTLVVYGGKGMGKTNFASVLAEELSASQIRFSAIDPMGVMWGLRHAADGKGPGIEVLILGGRHGDIPIEPTGGVVVADLVVDEEVDVVIDISRHADGKTWSVGQKIRFVTDYVERLHERQGERMRPIMQIIDEAGRFCPQTIPHGAPELAKCVGSIERLVEEGRNVGIGVTLITQRSARMNKSVSELADCMVAFRTVGPRSVGAVLDWFGEHVPKERHKELVEELRKLKRGTALVVSPGWLEFEGTVQVRARATFDSSPTPSEGGQRRALGKGARPDLARYEQRMRETIERAQADDPKKLRARIAVLERELEAKPKAAPAVAPPPPEKVLANGELVTLGRAVAELGERVETLQAIEARIRQAMLLVRTVPSKPIPARKPAPPTRTAVPRATHDTPTDTSLKRGARTMLQSLASMGRPLTRQQLATLSGVTVGGGTFGDYLSRLRTLGYVSTEAGIVEITDAGIEAAGDVPAPRTALDLQAMWNARLKAGARAMWQALIERYPEGMTRAELAEATGTTVTGGTFGDYLSTLNSNGLIEKRADGIYASPSLFLEAE